MSVEMMLSSLRWFAGLVGALGVSIAPAAAQAAATSDEMRAIARDAYLYAFPIVDGYKTLYAQAVDVGGPDYKAPFNHIGNSANVFTPDDKAIITPNSDTPYSFVWMDLRAESIVLTLPKVDPARYFSVQLIDLYTHNFSYLGRRTTGSDGGAYLIAGPTWKGAPPPGVSAVIRSETEIAYALYRTQLFNRQEIDNVRRVQAGYRVQPLSAFTGTPPPQPAPPVTWLKPQADMLDSPAMFRYLNFLLAFAPTDPSEQDLMKRFAKIGIGPGRPFDEHTLPAATGAALVAGIADGKQEFGAFKKSQIDTHKVTSADFFGTREVLKNNYLYRYAGARLGIYGNSGAEAIYTGYFVDADGEPPDAAKHRYSIRFAPGSLPPADAFWSITMYDGRNQLLVPNPLKRYLINSSMEPQLKRDPAGGVTLHLQSDSPGEDAAPNWLPAPRGPFYAVLRMYQPRVDVQTGQWTAPPLHKAE